jgi:predicted ATP-dependent Lon-type protease
MHNPIEDDDYAFYIEDLRPIQISRFDFSRYMEGRKAFTRDEWIAVILRTVGLEPTKLSQRVKMHFIARLAPWSSRTTITSSSARAAPASPTSSANSRPTRR